MVEPASDVFWRMSTTTQRTCEAETYLQCLSTSVVFPAPAWPLTEQMGHPPGEPATTLPPTPQIHACARRTMRADLIDDLDIADEAVTALSLHCVRRQRPQHQ
jgi:hypothetical protein